MTPEDRRNLLASSGLARLTPHTITSQRDLEAQFEAAARDGYASSVEELEEGLNAIAAPVRDHTGGVIAAVSVSGPVYRFTEERMHEVAPDVVAAAAAISNRMGHLD
jgi:DNA-binding IclR family transcriptional regulator